MEESFLRRWGESVGRVTGILRATGVPVKRKEVAFRYCSATGEDLRCPLPRAAPRPAFLAILRLRPFEIQRQQLRKQFVVADVRRPAVGREDGFVRVLSAFAISANLRETQWPRASWKTWLAIRRHSNTGR